MVNFEDNGKNEKWNLVTDPFLMVKQQTMQSVFPVCLNFSLWIKIFHKLEKNFKNPLVYYNMYRIYNSL